ncbi:nicotinate-nucleotide--dimethylbenzimidazole phosphoribosyltransferase [Jeongeupia naejangsanensis]|uniref:Nicotinate-nucleotide--dimethylbenzimidazole phosphoribosyltransferase n=1 Tax=Jeongeupia naejangsanensis TaxID=613195 RepID=A0ABS2BPG7_9NEIS|nr:nicotinate-nucleotide--dimethylbenzimidazole phosphoribosyltransferase [Jeongeupia naejangsanensis]MBM3117525.1 nicotinate-nucleotide--dimethylbenzimidazole phosphoribosyltransferase [Jeongeupia naejangsanensis]
MSKIDPAVTAAALARQNTLTKPPGSLGRLEALAVWFASRQGNVIPARLQPAIVVFAADHGVAAEGVSAFPAEVTGQMVSNFVTGGAAINVLAREAGASLSIVDVGVAHDYPFPAQPAALLFRTPVAQGTRNLRREAAMSVAECTLAWNIGRETALEAIGRGKTLLIGGEMGIANTTAAACLTVALAGISADDAVGNGTGIDDAGRLHKVAVVADSVARARAAGASSARDWLAEVGGLEIAALAGFYTAAAHAGVPVVLDGFISSAAALVAVREDPAVANWLLASHCSHERGHRALLSALQLEPLVDLGLRLGEASGAALVLPLLQSALALHREMATFESAGISDGSL